MLRTLTIAPLILAFLVEAVALPRDAPSRKRRPPQPVLLTCHVHEWGLFSWQCLLRRKLYLGTQPGRAIPASCDCPVPFTVSRSFDRRQGHVAPYNPRETLIDPVTSNIITERQR